MLALKKEKWLRVATVMHHLFTSFLTRHRRNDNNNNNNK